MAAGAAPRILLVGAGAVGQVYGRHLQLGGADISFLVRPQYAAAVRRGFDLYPLRKRGRRDAVRLQDFAVLTETAAVAAQRWDAVFLCVSSFNHGARRLYERLGLRVVAEEPNRYRMST